MGVRLNKYISECGYCSRRAADALIDEGRVTIDGKVATLGDRVEEGQLVCVDQKPLAIEERKVYIALHKPVGIVCTAEKREKDNVIDYLNLPIRVYPMGRLDKDSQGLLLLSNDGELMNQLLKANNGHEKEYVVTVNRPLNDTFVQRMAGGVPILDRITAPCKVEALGEKTFRIVLTQGLNRQIRRMCEYLGYQVVKLERVRVMNITLEGIAYGKYRELTADEVDDLRKLVLGKNS